MFPSTLAPLLAAHFHQIVTITLAK
jgi:hypothetical protein